MKRIVLLATMLLVSFTLTGCPGSNRGGGNPLLLDGYYKPTPPADVADIAGELDIEPDVPVLPCGTDEDCDNGWVCHPDWNICVECTEDEHCHENAICLDNICVEQPACDIHTPCPDGLVCDYELGLCVECVTDGDCPDNHECIDHVCEEKKPPCETDADCPEGMVCNVHLNECVYCIDDSDCLESQWCDLDNGECLEDLCEPGLSFCVTGGVKTCNENGSGYGDTYVCPEGTVCQDGECVPLSVCVPGESFCLNDTSLKICNDNGSEWFTVECAPAETCQDMDGHAQCVGQCIPICDEPYNTCGMDEAGCGVLCDSCAPGTICPDDAMGAPPGKYMSCEPICSCEGKQCGDNGCGESCGECQPGYACQAGQCIYLGYDCAQGWECILSCSSLPNDACVMACISGTMPEHQGLLLDFVGCVQNYCGGEVKPGCAQEVAQSACSQYANMCLNCQPQCAGKECGNDGCGGVCGVCDDGFVCQNYKCVGSGNCEEILSCIENSQAPPDIVIPMCMAPATPEAQAIFLKLADCVQMVCNEFAPQSECYYDAISTVCADVYGVCKDCVPSCFGKECGNDGCGGVCGFCDEGYDCDAGVCVCIPDCNNKECGPDGCGNLCGICPPNFTCTPWGECDCTPDCVGKECGPDGCGGTCGSCNPTVAWCSENGNCIPYDCQPGEMECDGDVPLICGPDGWVALAACEYGTYCMEGICVEWACQPGTTKCDGNGVATCAANGAGWLEPELCPAGTKCQAGQCIPTSGCGDIPKVGCCDGNTLMVCTDDGSIAVTECGPEECGWIPNWGYGCGGFGEDPSGQFPLECPGTCQPQCLFANGTPKECGPDGCGDVCGLCPPDMICNSGLCEDFCIPTCQGKECGNDGCGGVCGLCAPDELCQDGSCIVPPACADLLACAQGCYVTGDPCFNMCTEGVDQNSQDYQEFKSLWLCATDVCAPMSDPACFQDALYGACYPLFLACASCTPSCAGLMCGPDGCGGSCGDCGDSAECVDGQCIPVCIPDCTGKECGPNGCGGQCGLCKPGYECDGGQCIYICKPQCIGKECGPDGCGGQCGFCADNEFCSDNGQCIPGALCGDGFCDVEEGESCYNCPIDCGDCPNGCEPTPFPGCGGCGCEACVCGMDPYCCEVEWDSLCVEECYECGGCCEPNCAGKECGPDGCGGSCGTCTPGFTCKSGQCEVVCEPDCDGKECGSDGCGGTCGTCAPNETCKNNVCFSGKSCEELIQCAIACVQVNGAECLFDCLDQGTPEAQDKFFDLVQCVTWQCGLNLDLDCLLGAMNGACQDEYNACQDCQPDCTNKQCGPDGCGGTCGLCNDGFYCDNYKCKPICTPDCTGKECGSNGCGGSCGSCAADEECQDGLCIPVCVPNCTGKQCGSDGCGGLCGTCPPSTICQNFKCIPVGPICGDGECNYWDGETCQNCPEDCGFCGDGCTPTDYPGCNGCPCEECVCSMDAYCCEVQWDSICVNECQECGGCGCVPLCDGKECGPDGCGGLCGACPPDMTCKNGACVEICQPSCLGKQCGPDGCGGSCGNCPQGFKCDAEGSCVPVCIPDCEGKQCGPDGCNGQCGLCGPDEACLSGQCQTAWDCELLLDCVWDCPEGDQQCTDDCWDKSSPEAHEQYILIWECILEVCGPEPVEPCPGQAILYGECQDEFNACLDCTPSCTGKQCGPDGCGGSCGSCPPGYECDAFGYCDCIPNCAGKECGSDGCGGTCGECPVGFLCNLSGKCICLPDCAGKECGDDGCGGTCGTCPAGFTCKVDTCIEACQPVCISPDGTPKECGPDGCGGQCGYCPPGLICTAQGKCQQIGPVCGDAECASNNGENCYSCPQDCGSCTGDCCEPHDGVGCSDPKVTQCVCEMDPFCCNSNWDSICANEAADQCNADCGCTPDCDGKECGSDGCGGYCGICPPNAYCSDDGQCITTCDPECDGKQCGPDGCGGSCGSCPAGNQCNAQGQCVCVPNCWNKECGPDGCGGSCGSCGQFETCTGSGKCKIVTPLCGDGNCMTFIGEDCDSCPEDCGECCGNGTCEPGFQETCQSCSQDCGECCGNGFCESQYGETCEVCPQDCGPCPAKCGDGICAVEKGETCTNCPIDCGECPSECGDGVCDPDLDENCVSCQQDCGPCQGDCCTANGSPGCQDPEVQDCVCAQDPYCCNVTWDGICADEVESLGCGKCQTQFCGDGQCSPGEDCETCPTDCGPCPSICGDGICDEDLGESCETCPGDCGECPTPDSCCEVHDTPGCNDPDIEFCVCSQDSFCCNNYWDSICVQEAEDCGGCGCVPDCEGKECGDDGCGGSCGFCNDPDQTCSPEGLCVGGSEELSCSEILQCATGCGTNVGCYMDCNTQGTPEGQQLFMSLMGCVLQNCFPLSTQCMIQAFMGSCSDEYQKCAAN